MTYFDSWRHHTQRMGGEILQSILYYWDGFIFHQYEFSGSELQI